MSQESSKGSDRCIWRGTRIHWVELSNGSDRRKWSSWSTIVEEECDRKTSVRRCDAMTRDDENLSVDDYSHRRRTPEEKQRGNAHRWRDELVTCIFGERERRVWIQTRRAAIGIALGHCRYRRANYTKDRERERVKELRKRCTNLYSCLVSVFWWSTTEIETLPCRPSIIGHFLITCTACPIRCSADLSSFSLESAFPVDAGWIVFVAVSLKPSERCANVGKMKTRRKGKFGYFSFCFLFAHAVTVLFSADTYLM